jgi:hypothetical protein
VKQMMAQGSSKGRIGIEHLQLHLAPGHAGHARVAKLPADPSPGIQADLDDHAPGDQVVLHGAAFAPAKEAGRPPPGDVQNQRPVAPQDIDHGHGQGHGQGSVQQFHDVEMARAAKGSLHFAQIIGLGQESDHLYTGRGSKG